MDSFETYTAECFHSDLTPDDLIHDATAALYPNSDTCTNFQDETHVLSNQKFEDQMRQDLYSMNLLTWVQGIYSDSSAASSIAPTSSGGMGFTNFVGIFG